MTPKTSYISYVFQEKYKKKERRRGNVESSKTNFYVCDFITT